MKTMRQNILLRRRTTPQRVRLPNRQSFLARYERVSRRNFPRIVTTKRTRTIGSRKQRKRQVQTDGSIRGQIAKLEQNSEQKRNLKKG